MELGRLTSLVTLSAQSNRLRQSTLPLAELGGLPQLRAVDLRFNSKLKASAAGLFAEAVPQAKALLADPAKPPAAAGSEPKKKETSADRDATLLRSQLEPLSTPTLRRRMTHSFGTPTDPDTVDREQLMLMLLQKYADEGPSSRVVRPVSDGAALEAGLREALLGELRGTDWPSTMRERLSVRAEGYITLHRPAAAAPANTQQQQPQTKAGKLQAAKLETFQRLWELAAQAIEAVDPVYAAAYSAIAVCKSTHSTRNLHPQRCTFRRRPLMRSDCSCGQPSALSDLPTSIRTMSARSTL